MAPNNPVVKQRYSNPVIGEIVKLQFFVYNSNMYAEVESINSVSIYYLDRSLVNCGNPDGRTLVQTIPGTTITNLEQGKYELDLYLDPAIYKFTGRYLDEWNVTFMAGEEPANATHLFQIYPELWYTTPIPVVYDFSFYFQPNKIRHGSKKFIEIEIKPNVPTATDLANYYENLAIISEVFVTISLACGPCMPCESDLAIIVDNQPCPYREKNRAFYFIDTDQFDCGIYDIYFTLKFGGSTYISDTNQIQIYS